MGIIQHWTYLAEWKTHGDVLLQKSYTVDFLTKKNNGKLTPQSLEKQIDKLQQEMWALVKIVAQGGDSDFYAAKLRNFPNKKWN